MKNWCALIVALSVVAACTSSGTNSAAQRTDSAGVEIVRIPATAVRSLPWRFDSAVTALIRADYDTAAPSTGIMGAKRLKDGRILLHDQSKGEQRPPRLFDSTCRLLMTLGRKGRGPGEFEALAKTGLLPGDSVWAYDASLMAISVFTPSGAFVRRMPVSGMSMSCAADGAFADGSIAFWCAGSMTGGTTTNYVRVTSDGVVHEKITSDSARYVTESMWSPSTVFGVGARMLHRGDPMEYEIRSITETGRLARILRIDLPPRAPTKEEIDHQRAFLIELMTTSGGQADFARKAIMARPIPARLPAWSMLMEDADGNLWAKELHAAWDLPPHWMVFDPRGNLLGRIETPAGWSIQYIGHDFVLVGIRDSEGMNRLEMHTMKKQTT